MAEGEGQTLLRMSGWRGMSIELVAELDTAAGRLLLYLDWWAQLTATRLRLVTVGHSHELVARENILHIILYIKRIRVAKTKLRNSHL